MLEDSAGRPRGRLHVALVIRFYNNREAIMRRTNDCGSFIDGTRSISSQRIGLRIPRDAADVVVARTRTGPDDRA